METLLASIRKAINIDMGLNGHAADFLSGTYQPMKGSMHELRVKFENDLAKGKGTSGEIAELRNRINRNRTSDAILEPAFRPNLKAAAPPLRRGFEAILAGDMASKNAALEPEPEFDAPQLRSTFQEQESDVKDYGVYQAPYEDHAEVPGPSWQNGDGQSYLPVVQYDDAHEDYNAQALMSEDPALAAQVSFNQLSDTLMAHSLGERSIEDVTHDMLRGMLKNWLDTHLPSLVERLVREEIERVARRGR